MADYLGITNQAYSNYENGAREPSHDTLVKLADYFNVTVDYILGRADNTDEPEEENENIKVALFGGEGEVTDEMWDEVKRFAEFVKLREKERHGKS